MKRFALAAVVAASLWQPAAASDFHYGQRLYSLGDYAGARAVWEPLAQGGDARAQYSLAILYRKGQGVEKDKQKAIEWADRASAQGYQPAKVLSQRLKEKPRPVAVEKAAKRPGTAAATDDRPPRVQWVEQTVQDLLNQFGARAAGGGGLEHGPVRVTEKGDVIDIAVPDIVVKTKDGGVFRLGTVRGKVVSEDQRFDRITLALPEIIPFRIPKTGNGEITIAEREAKLRWDHQLRTSTEYRFRFADIAIALAENGVVGRIGEFLIASEVVEDKGRWSGPVRFEFANIDLRPDETRGLVLDQAGIAVNLTGLDLPKYLKAGGQPGQAPKGLIDAEVAAGLRARVAGLSVSHPEQGTFKLQRAEAGLDLSSRDGRLLTLALFSSHAGLTGSGASAPGKLAPREMDLRLVLDNIPAETMVRVGVAAAVEVALLGELSSGPQILQRARDDLGAAGTVLRLERFTLTAEDYNARLDGTVLADGTAATGFVGGMELHIEGLAALLRGAGVDDKGKEQPSMLAGLAAQGEPVAGGKGQRYRFALQPDGKLTLNDEPLISLAPPAPKAETKPRTRSN
ncbi:MAG: hypothetical protein QF578_12885 [Alphaproteobacteria bacterium]|nr:hypothetical protein [Alphaproteobacteria bacterium]MDP6565713.1 hypothetical protein [Alphaproteobacteria bacterium]